ncbi:hypothetical protein L6164_004362 [Bauhinia variegata]|uniref:Uncharacterized protein n=1 Tax=Bauhinia variegata TaxID=167791 RepID=A0ACB9Q4U8_BAUVA|nr:hypothetical protein L6164_004362 [Bauhinia variegata]
MINDNASSSNLSIDMVERLPKSIFTALRTRNIVVHFFWRQLQVQICISFLLISALMSAGGAFGGNRGMAPVPPEKGIFPLDHMHLCDLEKKEYVSCLKTSGHQSEKCRQFSKKYLQCRMEKNLMAKQDLSELGFK